LLYYGIGQNFENQPNRSSFKLNNEQKQKCTPAQTSTKKQHSLHYVLLFKVKPYLLPIFRSLLHFHYKKKKKTTKNHYQMIYLHKFSYLIQSFYVCIKRTWASFIFCAIFHKTITTTKHIRFLTCT
jgi:hypothetical protein